MDNVQDRLAGMVPEQAGLQFGAITNQT